MILLFFSPSFPRSPLSLVFFFLVFSSSSCHRRRCPCFIALKVKNCSPLLSFFSSSFPFLLTVLHFLLFSTFSRFSLPLFLLFLLSSSSSSLFYYPKSKKLFVSSFRSYLPLFLFSSYRPSFPFVLHFLSFCSSSEFLFLSFFSSTCRRSRYPESKKLFSSFRPFLPLPLILLFL